MDFITNCQFQLDSFAFEEFIGKLLVKIKLHI